MYGTSCFALVDYVLILVFETLYVVYHFNKIFDFYYES